MARIATLLGKDVKSSNWSSLGVADGNGISELLELRDTLSKAGGLLKKGKTELQFSELRILATGTAGGELKARRKFR